MGGGVNPLEWLVPPVALTHTLIDQGAKAAGTSLPAAPGSPDEKVATASEAQQDQLNAQRQATEERRLAEPRSQTPGEESSSRTRAERASEQLGGGRKRRASQTLTSSDMLLSGASAGSYGF